MNRVAWTRRAAALAAVMLLGVALTSVTRIASGLAEVGRARADAPAGPAKASTTAAARWRTLKPLLRRNGATAKVAIGEHLNGQLGQLGLNVVSVETPNVRAMGGGLLLAEVHVQARGDAAASAAAANWVTVNREAVRLKSLTLGVGPDGIGTCGLVLLMVIA